MTENTASFDMDSFASFGLSGPMLEALKRKGFSAPTSIQSIALPRLLGDEGHLIVKARTGTGKTAAFGIPLVECLTSGGHAPRALVLTPTRELALQVSREIASLVPRRQDGDTAAFSGVFPRVTAVYGGASIRNQILDLKRGTEIVVGTPGRVIDLMERKILDFSAINWFILDEADEMLDMGFFEDVEKILNRVKGEGRILSELAPEDSESPGGEKQPREPLPGSSRAPVRLALFSATMPEAILKVIQKHIGNVKILQDTAPVDEKPLVDQFYMVLKKEDRMEALRRIIDQAEDFYGLVFCATKVETDELARRLVEGGYTAEAIHGDLSQEARERTLRRFRSRQTTILVATDVAARGLDIERLSHVINWDLPNDREAYIHRIGRTGRAGRRGRALSLALPGERGRMDHLSRSMEKNLGSSILWTKVPSVKSVMKAIKSRIRQSVLAAAAESFGSGEDMADTGIAADTPAAESSGSGAGVVDTGMAPNGQEGSAPVDNIGMAADAIAAEGNASGSTAAESSGSGAGMVDTGMAPNAAEGNAGSAPAAENTGVKIAVEQKENIPEMAALSPDVSPAIAQLSRELTERLGAETAVTVLLSMNYGEALDSSRYGEITEIPEFPLRLERIRSGGKNFKRGGQNRRAAITHSHDDADDASARVYVGLGRHHGAGARDVAALLGRAGGVPGRFVNAIEIKDFCAFATMPADAARRAAVFSRNSDTPAIRIASPRR